ncbi:sulfite exporter TauE/SafE family protein [Latilactobacillus graminis]|uniref:Probable membrane transporter protein n=2 Tax=Latilactobacillus graminis TaxID=60519 RepID=A0AA89KXS6_9LACO|nr:sulfite exporter TauE/SafE family protein [Latilactobacillus graminis]KRM23665.1 hypothetical protein FC90_GL000129 [Latilactobacillus graminis DSM 20719]QFP80148.1 sulfite exporter TauE/SafE family protein [Latilactobacillus graminis]
MGKIVLYVMIILFSNTIGAISGMGGGVIIKPVLDLLSGDPLVAINFYSSFAVFIMSIVSTGKGLKRGVRIDWHEALFLSAGSIIGGKLGDGGFILLSKILQNDHSLNLIQIIIVVIALVLALLFSKSGGFHFNKQITYFLFVLSGLALGMLSTFLGIGGGPINVAVIIYLFGFEPKKAAFYSIISIFFSQLIKLLTNLSHVSDLGLNVSLLPGIAIAAIIGGYLGAVISCRLTNRTVLSIYRAVVVCVIGLNVYNGIMLVI